MFKYMFILHICIHSKGQDGAVYNEGEPVMVREGQDPHTQRMHQPTEAHLKGLGEAQCGIRHDYTLKLTPPIES